jgi:hypothetical protein
MTLVAEVVPLQSGLPQAEFQWDFDTEILSGRLSGASGSGAQRVIELGGPGGTFMSLGLDGPVMTGLEIVVWPQSEAVSELTPPDANKCGQLKIYPNTQERSSGVVELTVPLGCERNGDLSVIHLKVGNPRSVESVAVADGLLAELDDDGHLAGFWLLNVPPFPESGPHR